MSSRRTSTQSLHIFGSSLVVEACGTLLRVAHTRIAGTVPVRRALASFLLSRIHLTDILERINVVVPNISNKDASKEITCFRFEIR